MAETLQPPGWPRPRGYANGIAASGRLVFVAGQVGWDAQGGLVGPDLVAQVRQALRNAVAVLAEGGARPEHVARMTWYLGSRDEYRARLAEIGVAYREVMGRAFPAMTAVQVAGFVEEGVKVEIEVTAVVPEPPGRG